MRPPLFWFTATFGAGLATGLVFLVPPGAVLVLALVAAAMAARGKGCGVLVAGFVVGTSVGGVAAHQRRATCATRWEAGPHAAILRLHDAPDDLGRGRATLIHAPEGCGGTVSVRLRIDSVRSGAHLVAVGVTGRSGTFTVRHARILDRTPKLRYRLRDRVGRRIARLYGDRAGLVAALVLGRRGDIPPPVRQRFVDSGLAHLLAISGLHIGVLAAWLGLLGRALGAGRYAWIGAAGCVWLYVAFLGFPASAVRAGSFVTLHGIARVRQRHLPAHALLAVTVLGILVVAPGTVRSVGAWLSCAAVWGTVTASRLLPRAGAWIGVRRLAAVSAGATLCTAPITAFVFGAVAPIGVITNLAAVPLAGLAVPGVFASLVFGAPLAGGSGLVLAALERAASFGAALPGGHLNGPPGVAFAFPWMLGAATAVWLAVRRPRWIVVRWRLLAAALCVSWGAVVIDRVPLDGADGFALYFLDVGQGDAIVLRTPGGRWVLIDGGPRTAARDAGRRVVAPFLRRRGVRALDAVLVSHGDADHLGGLPAVVRAFPIGALYEPGQPIGSALYAEHLQALEDEAVSWRAGRAGDTLTVDGVTLILLHPSAAWMRREVRVNENSLVVRVRFGAFDALLTGDIGWPAESALVRAVDQVEVLKVGHHGSAGSTTSRWLDAVRPRVAVVSVGPNGYGHPAPAVLERLRERRIPLYRTDRGGTVTIRSDGHYFQVRQGGTTSLRSRLLCHVDRWLRSKVSSSTRNGCIPRQPGNSPTSFTTWRSAPRTSPRS